MSEPLEERPRLKSQSRVQRVYTPTPTYYPAHSIAGAGNSADWRSDVNRKLEAAAQAAIDWGAQQEHHTKDLEAELASALSNSRAVHSLLVEATSSIESSRQRVDLALMKHVPTVDKQLTKSVESLSSMQTSLPRIHEQVRAIRDAYESGRTKAKALVRDLEWKHAPVQDKLVRIVFARDAPVAPREIMLVRLAVILLCLVLTWQLAGAVDGAYRAYRHRLLWGDKLIS